MPEMPPKPKLTPPTYPILRREQICSMVRDACGDPHFLVLSEPGDHMIMLLPEALEEMKMLTHWGSCSPLNYTEIMFQGIGHFFRQDDKSYNMIVSHMIPIYSTNRTPVSAGMQNADGSENPCLQMTNFELEQYRLYETTRNRDRYGYLMDPCLKYGPSEYTIEGHTHPDIGCFFSGPDRKLGAARACGRPLGIMVCDPVRQEVLAAVGKNFEPATVVGCFRDSDVTPVFPRKRFSQTIADWMSPAYWHDLYQNLVSFTSFLMTAMQEETPDQDEERNQLVDK